jgi:hypothetical protein
LLKVYLVSFDGGDLDLLFGSIATGTQISHLHHGIQLVRHLSHSQCRTLVLQNVTVVDTRHKRGTLQKPHPLPDLPSFLVLNHSTPSNLLAPVNLRDSCLVSDLIHHWERCSCHLSMLHKTIILGANWRRIGPHMPAIGVDAPRPNVREGFPAKSARMRRRSAYMGLVRETRRNCMSPNVAPICPGTCILMCL